MIRVRITQSAIDIAAEYGALEGDDSTSGALATFVGRVRADDGVTRLELEHYSGATEAALEKIALAAVDRWELDAAVIVHRVGPMVPGDRIVFVGTSARHRQAALDACSALIDRLKIGAPFWKREERGEKVSWVAARDDDHSAAARWD